MRHNSSSLVYSLIVTCFICISVFVAAQKFDPRQADADYGTLSSQNRVSFILGLCEKEFTNPAETDTWILVKLQSWENLTGSLSSSELNDLLGGLKHSQFLKSRQFFAHTVLNSKNNKLISSTLRAHSAHILTELFIDFHQMDSTVHYLGKMKGYLDENSDSTLWAGFFSSEGIIKKTEGDYFGAIVSYQKGLDYLTNDEEDNAGAIYQNMALAYKSLNYYEKAEFYMERALRLIQKREAWKSALSSLAVIKMHLEKLEESEKIHRFVLAQEKKYGNELAMAMAYTNLANVKRRKKEYAPALQSLDSSDVLCAKLQINIGLLINKINRSEILADSGLSQMALPILQSAEFDLQSMPSVELSMEVSRLLARIYDQLGSTVKSDAYFRKYITVRDSLLGDDRKTAIVEWEFSREREMNALKNADLTAALLRQKFQKQTAFLLSGFLAALLLAAFVLLRRRQERMHEKSRRDKERLEFELELKSKELVAESMKALSVDQAKEDIYKKLHTLVGSLPKTHHPLFSGLFNELRRKENDINWEEFESRFLGVYEEFFAKLKNRAPDITPAEVRICALMRLNRTTKEISRISGKTQGTIDNTRSRIRKKLGLSDEENLYDFLGEI
jgi:tetratricopeptide (TPR) repeat protein/DNA-binding CsgD family transcriptional regulator